MREDACNQYGAECSVVYRKDQVFLMKIFGMEMNLVSMLPPAHSYYHF